MSHSLSSRQSLSVTVIVVMVLSLWVLPSWAERKTPAPVVDATGAGGSGVSLQGSSSSASRGPEYQTLLELMQRVDSLQNEVQQMLSGLEEQAHNLDELAKRQKDIYLDVDQRIRKLEQGGTVGLKQAPAMGAFVPTPAVVPGAGVAVDPAINLTPPGNTSPGIVSSNQAAGSSAVNDSRQERIAYEKAFSQLKNGQYDQAVMSFKAFVKSYPQGYYAGNAQYWLGEAKYALRDYPSALTEFEKVIKEYPTSPKRADAMLKMGYTYQELGKLDKAQASLLEVTNSYPNSTAANLAQIRLQELKRRQ